MTSFPWVVLINYTLHLTANLVGKCSSEPRCRLELCLAITQFSTECGCRPPLSDTSIKLERKAINLISAVAGNLNKDILVFCQCTTKSS